MEPGERELGLGLNPLGPQKTKVVGVSRDMAEQGGLPDPCDAAYDQRAPVAGTRCADHALDRLELVAAADQRPV